MDSSRLLHFIGIIGLITFLVTLLGACSSKLEPAPVVSLSTKTASAENLTEILGDTYVVESGDTLFAIAFYSGNDYRELARLNSLQAPYPLSIGQSLVLNSQKKANITKQNTATKDAAQISTKIEVDPNNPLAYGENTLKNHRDKKKNNSQTSNKPKRQATKKTWIWPANGVHALATVGSDGGKRGLDIKGKQGSSVVASASGKVVYAGNALKGYGNLIIIKHDDQYLSAYAHNNLILVGEQTYVNQGQKIATMGNSGASEVMLHFEIRKKGKSMDPFAYLPKQ